jgi:hypothetical protein
VVLVTTVALAPPEVTDTVVVVNPTPAALYEPPFIEY